jgi:hypothetical protein
MEEMMVEGEPVGLVGDAVVAEVGEVADSCRLGVDQVITQTLCGAMTWAEVRGCDGILMWCGVMDGVFQVLPPLPLCLCLFPPPRSRLPLCFVLRA